MLLISDRADAPVDDLLFLDRVSGPSFSVSIIFKGIYAKKIKVKNKVASEFR
jgi:hypothetical protein